MKINKVRWLNIALKDFIALTDFIYKDDQEAGHKIAEQIWIAAQSLKLAPNRGRPGRRAGTRELILPNLPYFIVYWVKNEEVQIIRVLHTSRKYTS